MIQITSCNAHTRLVDQGRMNFRDSGIPHSGPMDSLAFYAANQLVGNDLSACTIEMALGDLEIQFNADVTFAITGATVQCTLDEKRISIHHAISANSGSHLKIFRPSQGVWNYVSLWGGIKSESILGSQSQFAGITPQSRLSAGDRLELGLYASSHRPGSFPQADYGSLIKVQQGPEFHLLERELMEHVLSKRLHVLTGDRMSKLINSEVHHDLGSIPSVPVLPGIVQITPNGQLLALMSDCQTTGGYPRVFVLDAVNRSKLAQRSAGSPVQFVLDKQTVWSSHL